MDISQWSALIGLFSFLLVLIITLIYQKRLDRSDLGALTGVFFSRNNYSKSSIRFYKRTFLILYYLLNIRQNLCCI